jgi:hypothetical protein
MSATQAQVHSARVSCVDVCMPLGLTSFGRSIHSSQPHVRQLAVDNARQRLGRQGSPADARPARLQAPEATICTCVNHPWQTKIRRFSRRKESRCASAGKGCKCFIFLERLSSLSYREIRQAETLSRDWIVRACDRPGSIRRYKHRKIQAKSAGIFAAGTHVICTNVSEDTWPRRLSDTRSAEQDRVLDDPEERSGQVATNARAWSLYSGRKGRQRDKPGCRG